MHASIAPELLVAVTEPPPADSVDEDGHNQLEMGPAGQEHNNSVRPFRIGFVSTLLGEHVRDVSPSVGRNLGKYIYERTCTYLG